MDIKELEKLKVKPGNAITAERITSIVQAIIDNKKALLRAGIEF